MSAREPVDDLDPAAGLAEGPFDEVGVPDPPPVLRGKRSPRSARNPAHASPDSAEADEIVCRRRLPASYCSLICSQIKEQYEAVTVAPGSSASDRLPPRREWTDRGRSRRSQRMSAGTPTPNRREANAPIAPRQPRPRQRDRPGGGLHRAVGA